MEIDKLKVLDLFSGIGGFSLGLEAAGMETVALKVGYEPKYFKKFCKKNFIQIPNNKAASCNKPK